MRWADLQGERFGIELAAIAALAALVGLPLYLREIHGGGRVPAPLVAAIGLVVGALALSWYWVPVRMWPANPEPGGPAGVYLGWARLRDALRGFEFTGSRQWDCEPSWPIQTGIQALIAWGGLVLVRRARRRSALG